MNTGDWTVAKNSGWIDYANPYTWTLSAGQGVRYLGVWLADAAGNVSTLDEQSMIFVNRMDASQALADGQRVQYRGLIQGGEWIEGLLSTLNGDPDLFVWGPRNAYWPDRSFNEPSQPGSMEYFANQFPLEPGRYLIEVQAVGATEYGLTMKWLEDPWALASAAKLDMAAKERPQHPLVVSDPLGAGQLGPAVTGGLKSYLPVLSK